MYSTYDSVQFEVQLMICGFPTQSIPCLPYFIRFVSDPGQRFTAYKQPYISLNYQPISGEHWILAETGVEGALILMILRDHVLDSWFDTDQRLAYCLVLSSVKMQINRRHRLTICMGGRFQQAFSELTNER